MMQGRVEILPQSIFWSLTAKRCCSTVIATQLLCHNPSLEEPINPNVSPGISIKIHLKQMLEIIQLSRRDVSPTERTKIEDRSHDIMFGLIRIAGDDSYMAVALLNSSEFH